MKQREREEANDRGENENAMNMKHMCDKKTTKINSICGAFQIIILPITSSSSRS